ncbi:MAG: hypothetical protein RIT81_02080 [Deltaproteobacteria bacterium]
MSVQSLDHKPIAVRTPEDDLANDDAVLAREPELSLGPVHPIASARTSSAEELTALMRQVQSFATQALSNPNSVFENAGEIINVIEKLMVLLAKEERKARHDRFSAKMTKLVQRIEKMLAAAQKTLEAGQKELDAISKKSGWQIAFAVLAVIIIAVAIAAAVATGGAAALMVGAALAAVMPVLGTAAGELHARGDTKDKQALNEESADLNAMASELEKLMENESELSAEAKELLRKLLEILMKIFEKLNASRRKATDGMTS